MSGRRLLMVPTSDPLRLADPPSADSGRHLFSVFSAQILTRNMSGRRLLMVPTSAPLRLADIFLVGIYAPSSLLRS
jgi:hypothetical protein